MSNRLRTLTVVPLLWLVGCVTDPAAAPADPATAVATPVLAPTQSGPTARAIMLRIRTYDGSGQSVHPDVVYFPAGWHGFEYWMAYTPYPGGREAFENPSLVVSHDGQTWRVPPGLKNPVVHPPVEEDGYNSDPDLRYDATTDQLQLVFRQVRRGFNIVRITSSADGIRWSRSRLLMAQPSHGAISPTIALGPDGVPRIWYVDAGSKRCAERETRVMTRLGGANTLGPTGASSDWGAPIETDLVQPGYFVWHLDVVYVADLQEYWAVYPAYRKGNCGGRDLFFATSRDGVSWRTFPSPIMQHERQRWTGATLYRASLLYDRTRDVIRIFLSGAAPGPTWHIGYVEYPYLQLLSRLETRADERLAERGRAPSAYAIEDR